MAEGKKRAVQDAWRSYLELAWGVTDASRKKAEKVARQLAGKGGATAQQLQVLADNLVTTSLANREALTKLVRFEVDRALGMVGLATAEEVADLENRVTELERQLRRAQARPVEAPAPAGAAVPAVPQPAGASPPAGTPPAKGVAKRAVAKRTVAKKASAQDTLVDMEVAGVAPVPAKGVAKKAVAGKARTPGTVAKKAAGGKPAPLPGEASAS